MFCKADLRSRNSCTIKSIAVKITAALLALSVFSGFVPSELVQSVVAYADDTTVTDEQGLTYTLQDGTYSVTGCDKSAVSIVIPEEYNGVAVTEIRYCAFQNCTSLTSITIPNSVTEIGYYAFENCTSLNSITIPNSVTEIRNSAFRLCTSLTDINIPNSVTEISDGTFASCTSLTNINIPNSVTSIGCDAFENCTSLTDINIPNSVTEIGYSAFENCTSLTEFNIPNGVTGIAMDTFEGCTLLTSITIPNSVTKIRYSAFSDCTSLSKIVIPNSVTEIGGRAFEGCTSLTNINIPNNVTKIGYNTFAGCTSLTDINIPNGVTEIENDAFDDCTSLTSITIPNSVTEIGSDAFAGCSSLTSITIPNSVTEIRSEAFAGCSSFTNINIPNSVTKIGYSAFSDCTSLSKIVIPNSVTEIGDRAFSGCSSLTKIAIPNNVTEIGDRAFDGCTSLTKITIPNNVTEIGNYAFYRCTSLTSIIIPGNVTSIGYNTFQRCPSTIAVYGEKNSYAKTYANNNNINFVPIVTAGSTSASDTLKTDMWSDNNGFFNASALSVDSLNCQIADSGSGYGPQNISWASSDDSIATVKEVISGENSAIDIPELKNNSTCYFAAMKEGYAVITASLPNGESLDFPVLVTAQKNMLDCDRSYIPSFNVSANGEYSNKSSIKLSFYNCALDSDSPTINQIYCEMLKDPDFLEQVTFDIGKISVALPDGFSFSEEKSEGGDTMNLDGVTTLSPKSRKDFEIPIYYCGDSLPSNQRTAAEYYSVSYSYNNTPVEYNGVMYLKNTDYTPETVTGDDSDPEPEQPDSDKPYEPKPSVTVDADNPMSAFENCYKAYLSPKNKTTSTLRSSFSDLQKYISDKAFNKIIADTEMFCTFEALSLPTDGDYDLSSIFGYDGMKASSFLDIGKKALLEFPKVEVNKNFYRTKKTVTVFVQLDNTGASIGGATASWCVASWYIKISDKECVKGGEKAQIVYSSLDSIKSELKQIYINNTHTSGSIEDYVAWVKTAIKDYINVGIPTAKVKVKSAEGIVNLIKNLSASINDGDLDVFRLSSVKDVTGLFDNIYDVGSGKYKLISIFCPVDVMITDSNGKILGSIVDNRVEVTSDDVQMSVDGDKKYCRISMFDDYDIQLTGSDSGTMDYIVEEVINDEIIRKSSFDNLDLTNSILYSGTINDIIFQSDDAYALTTNDGVTVAPDDDSYSFTLDEFSDVMSTITIPESVTVMKNNDIIQSSDMVSAGDELYIKAKIPSGKKLVSLTVDGIPIENGSIFTVGYEDVNIAVSFTDFSSPNIAVVNDCKLRIDDSIYADFYINFADIDYIFNADSYLEFSINGQKKLYEVSAAKFTESGYKFAFPVAIAELTDDIKIQLYIYDEPVGQELTYPMMDCVKYALNNPDEDTGDIALIKAMLNYGAAAQRFFNHNTALLANSILNESDKAVSTAANAELGKYKCTVIDKSANANFTGIRISINSTVTIKLYFKNAADKEVAIKTVDGYDSPYSFSSSSDEYGYYISIPNIKISDYAMSFNISVGEVTIENISVYSYLEMARSAGQTELFDIINSMYAFGKAYEAEKEILRIVSGNHASNNVAA